MTPPPGRSIGRWLLLAVWCAVLFLVPSAVVIDRGAPPWAAALVGAIAFPLAPVAWHVLAERARKRRLAALKVAPKATLTVLDRFVLRTIVIALVACAPWFAIARGRTLRAVWHHASWPVDWILTDTSTGAPAGDARFLQYVPSDAEAIVWIRSAPDLGELLGGDTTKRASDADDDGLIQAVIAIKHGELFGVVQAKKLDDVKPDEIDQAQARRWFGHELHFTKHRIAADTMVIVSDGWEAAYVARVTGKTPPAKALIDRLGPAPFGAVMVASAVPRGPIAGLSLRDASGSLRIDPDAKKLIATTTIHAADAGGAATLAALIKHAIDAQRDALPESCRAPVGALLDGIAVKTKGDVVSIDTAVAPEQIAGAMMCALAQK